MSNFSAMTLTDAGGNIAARFVAGEIPLTFSKFALGDGTASPSTDLKTLTDLVKWRQDVGIATVAHDKDNGKVTIRGNYTNAGVLEAYAAKEMGLYALDPATGQSVLFGYFTDSLPDTVPAESVRAITDIIAVTLVMNGSEKITATFDLGEFATIRDVEDRMLTVEDRMLTIDDIYPIGSIYMSAATTDPGKLFANTAWTALPAGRVLIGAGTTDAGKVYKAGTTGGEEKHKLTANEMPAHTHSISSVGDHKHIDPYGEAYDGTPFGIAAGHGHMGSGKTDFDNYLYWTSPAGAHTHTIGSAGSGAAHNNMPPYLVVYMWQRTA